MKTIFSSLVVFFVVLVVSQTASTTPISATSADYSALSAQPTSSQYTRSSWHSVLRSVRSFAENNHANDVDIEAVLVGDGDSLEFTPVTGTAVSKNDGLFLSDDFIFEKGDVKVSEPSLAALIALGLIVAGFVHRRKNH